MEFSAELSQWVGDPERKRRSRQAADQFARRWSDQSLLASFRHDLAALEPKTAESILAAAERLMSRSDELHELVGALIAEAGADPFFQPPFALVASEINRGLMLWDDPSVVVTLGVMSADALAEKKGGASGPSSISLAGRVTLYKFIKSGGATLSFWEAPEIGADFVGDGAGKCRFTGRRKIADGEQFVLDGRRESFSVEHAEGDMVVLQAIIHADAAPLAVEYDTGTLGFVGASSGDEASSRVQMMVSLLRLMDRKDSIPLIEQLIDSSHFYVRWHIMRELLALDCEAALPTLRRMAAADPHPEVRAAARQTLDLFFSEFDEEPAACRA